MGGSSVTFKDFQKYLAFLVTEANFVCDKLGHNLPYTVYPAEDGEDIADIYQNTPGADLALRCQLILAMLELNGLE